VKRRIGACDITLCEQRDRRDHQTRTEKRHCVCCVIAFIAPSCVYSVRCVRRAWR
jgi:hypothetical protein